MSISEKKGHGNTENMGLVSKCDQSNLVPVYINFFDMNFRRIYYTYDKKTGEIISKTKYKNPYKNLIQPK